MNNEYKKIMKQLLKLHKENKKLISLKENLKNYNHDIDIIYLLNNEGFLSSTKENGYPSFCFSNEPEYLAEYYPLSASGEKYLKNNWLTKNFYNIIAVLALIISAIAIFK